jgi:predicted  nucleic acid-binding Zn-ribbon protein
LISITCAECGEVFEIGEEFAGITEFCPACGALNDVPDADQEPGPDEAMEPAPAAAVPAPGRGIPTVLWWTILLAAVGLFAVACLFLFSDNWESRNVQTLADATIRGDVLMADEDYAAAAGQYRFVLDTVDHRTIESVFIRQLVDRARRGEADAEARLHASPTTMASTAPAPATRPAPATQGDVQIHLAIKSFQRDCEAFPSFIRGHPLLFQDAKGNWRRRQFVVWDVNYDPPTQSDSPRILLRYICASHITEPHHDRQEAAGDDNFVNDESPRSVRCQTQFEWLSNRWLIARRDADAEKDEIAAVELRPSLDDFYVLERQAFHANQISP